jgi:hypothetical protein
VLFPPLLDHLVPPLDHTPPLDEPVHLLELGDAPLLRKKVDLALFVHVAAHLQSPWCALRPLERLLHLCNTPGVTRTKTLALHHMHHHNLA